MTVSKGNSGIYAAGLVDEFGNEGHILLEGNAPKKAGACMDSRLPYLKKSEDGEILYARVAKAAGLNGHRPERMRETAKTLLTQGCTVVETHDDCGAFRLAELNAKKGDDSGITLEEINPEAVNLRARKYGRNLADLMEEISNDMIKVETVHITQDELDENHGAGRAFIFGKGVIPYYGQPGFKIGGGFDEEDILDSAGLAIDISKKPLEIVYMGGRDVYYDANIIRSLADKIANHEHSEKITLIFQPTDGTENYCARPITLTPAECGDNMDEILRNCTISQKDPEEQIFSN